MTTPGPPRFVVEATSRITTARQRCEEADAALTDAVVSVVRARHLTWQEVGEALGVTRQAAHARFSAAVGPRPRRPTREERDAQDLRAHRERMRPIYEAEREQRRRAWLRAHPDGTDVDVDEWNPADWNPDL